MNKQPLPYGSKKPDVKPENPAGLPAEMGNWNEVNVSNYSYGGSILDLAKSTVSIQYELLQESGVDAYPTDYNPTPVNTTRNGTMILRLRTLTEYGYLTQLRIPNQCEKYTV